MSQTSLTDTGERMIPAHTSLPVFWEHVERYRFASEYVRGKDVLDIACGTGYGSAGLLRAGAQSVIGMDISADAVAYARETYGVDARLGNAEAIELPDAAVDVVVSFETIEHVPQPTRFLDECVRILRPGGTAVISTPNQVVYDRLIDHNEFHCSEMPVEEFEKHLRSRFRSVRLLGQRHSQLAWMNWMASRRMAKALRATVDPLRWPWRAGDARAAAPSLCSNRGPSPFRGLGNDAVIPMPDGQLKDCMYVVAVASDPLKPVQFN